MQTFNNFVNFLPESSALNEGGAYGHLSHVFEDVELTFEDLYELIDRALRGNLSLESPAVEKIDGINLMCTVIGGKLRIARNVGHLKDYAKNSLTAEELIKKYDTNENLQNLFKDALDALEKNIESLPQELLEEIFDKGKRFISVEVVNSKRPVTVPYNFDFLVLHDVFLYDINGRAIDVDTNAGRKLVKTISEINRKINNQYKILGHRDVKFKQSENFEEIANQFKSDLFKLQKKYDLSNNHKIVDYYRYELEARLKQLFNFSAEDLLKLNKVYDRIILGDKSYSLKELKKDFINNEKFINFIIDGEKNGNIKKLKNSIIRPVEIIYTKLGVHVLKNTVGFINADQSEIAERMKKEITAAIDKLKNDKDPKALEVLMTNLERFDAAGGFESVVPAEGIVFTYKGKNYKFTGAFAAFHQLMSFYKF